jgi:transcriptional antiterminator RfaH
MLHETSRWIALYTRARCERSLAHYLHQRGLTSFVPLQRRRHTWSDRYAWVDEPLIPSYVFVHCSPVQHEHFYEAPGVVGVVTFHGRAAVVREEEIEFLRRSEHHGESRLAARQERERGRAAKIVGGPFEGYAGTVVQPGERYTIAVTIDELACAVHVTVPQADVELV